MRTAWLGLASALAFATNGCAAPPPNASSGAAVARRIVSIPPNLTYSYATVDDSVAHIVGVRDDVPARIEHLLLGNVFPRIDTVPRVAGVEQILRRKPDAVFDWIYANDEVDLMRAAGLPVVTFENGETAYATWPHAEGRIAGKAARANELERAYVDAERAVTRARGERPPERMVRVLLVSSIDPEIIGDAFPHAFALAGVRSTLGGRATIGLEAIVAMDPAVILLIGDNVAPAQLFDSPRWNVVPAVRARRVYEIPEEWPLYNGIVDEPLFGRWLAELAYPERMPRALRAAIRTAYLKTFRFRVDDADLDRALRLNDNRRSDGYVRRFGPPG